MEILKYIWQHKDWIFSGIGVTAIGFVVKILFSANKTNDGVKAINKSIAIGKMGNNNTLNIQSHESNDLNIIGDRLNEANALLKKNN